MPGLVIPVFRRLTPTRCFWRVSDWRTPALILPSLSMWSSVNVANVAVAGDSAERTGTKRDNSRQRLACRSFTECASGSGFSVSAFWDRHWPVVARRARRAVARRGIGVCSC